MPGSRAIKSSATISANTAAANASPARLFIDFAKRVFFHNHNPWVAGCQVPGVGGVAMREALPATRRATMVAAVQVDGKTVSEQSIAERPDDQTAPRGGERL
jgi:hypothetical protein